MNSKRKNKNIGRKNIILQRIVENYANDIPSEWFLSDVESFGISWKLFDYQTKAIENATKVLYLYYNKGADELYNLYIVEGLQDLEEELSIKKENEGFKILSEYYEVEDGKIPFKNFVNRSSFWMATGSGKTLVMVKLIELLHYLMKMGLIPKKDILILAPKDEILKQFKEHVDIYNSSKKLQINLHNLKEWEQLKGTISLFNENEIKVFYYRADNISEENKDKIIDYKTFHNNGNWYVILDEAHKGEKSTSKRQQYFTLLSKNGFLFNFSATFTDSIDIVTTVFDFKLDTFLKEGYGKKIYVSNQQLRSFSKKREKEFDDAEKRNIVAQTLILLALIRKHYKYLTALDRNLYHAPLLITLANSVNVQEADLKIFYQVLSDIARGVFNFEDSKNELFQALEEYPEYLFGLGEIDQFILQELQSLKEEEFYENVFNSTGPGSIEVIKIKGNSRELAFKLKNSSEIFMIIVASDIVKWEDNVLEGYEFGETIEESLFENINDKSRSHITILLGSRIFAEGWDSNRPNIINFINIGVNEEAKKFVLQAIGRGIRIEPISGIRKRFKHIRKNIFNKETLKKIERYNNLLESLFVFATNKEVVKNILSDLEKQSSEWIRVKGIVKNENIKEEYLPLLVPEFDYAGLNDKPFKINKKDFKNLNTYVNSIDAKVLILKENVKVRTLKKLKDDSYFILEGKSKSINPHILLKHIDNFFNKPVKRLKGIRILENHIIHYQNIRTNLEKNELEKLEREIKRVLEKSNLSEEEIDRLFDEGKISKDEYKQLIKQLTSEGSFGFEILNKYVDYEIFKEHYYVPILLKKNSKRFQHIIDVPSEIEFLRKLKDYLNNPSNKLKEYDWWYFSKIDENMDDIKIPYFDTYKGDYSNFCPDFIFWLKKGEKYYIKFVDPKGIEHTRNPIDKIIGFEEFKKEIEDIHSEHEMCVALHYFNEEIPPYIEKKYKVYWTSDFDEIFSCKCEIL